MKGKGSAPYRGGLLLQGKAQFGPSSFPGQAKRRRKKGGRGGKKGKGGGKRALLRGMDGAEEEQGEGGL